MIKTSKKMNTPCQVLSSTINERNQMRNDQVNIKKKNINYEIAEL